MSVVVAFKTTVGISAEVPLASLELLDEVGVEEELADSVSRLE